MARRMRNFAWSQTALGPPEAWPQSLKTSIRILLNSRQPMAVWWGEQHINLYNDNYAAFLCAKHPAALGQPASSVWPEVWEQLAPHAESARSCDAGTYDEAQPLIVLRNGYLEEIYLTVAYSPLLNDDGSFGGILCSVSDETTRVIGERQQTLLDELAARIAAARTCRQIYMLTAEALETDPDDLPFALLYRIAPEKQAASLAAIAGIARGTKAAPETIAFDTASLWPLAEVVRTCRPSLIEDLSAVSDDLPSGCGHFSPTQAIALPLALTGETVPADILVVGLNPLRLFENNYQRFLERVAAEISLAISNAQAYEAECRYDNRPAESAHEQGTLHPSASIAARISSFADGALHRQPDSMASLASHLLNRVEEMSRTAGARILVVDDNADLRSYLMQLLSTRWTVAAAPDGKAALDKLRQEPFDLVLTDVIMPELDGLGLLRELRLDPSLQTLPVIMLSARAEEESHIEELHAGADDYLIKPFSAREVIARVEMHLKLSASRRHLAAEKMALRESQERLLKTQQRLQAVMQAVPVGISFSDDPSCQHITGNPAVLAQFEVSPEENLSATAPDHTAPGRKVRFFRASRQVSASELPLQRAVAENREIPPMEMEVLLPSGRHWFVHASGAPIHDAQGQIIGGVAVTVDITERKCAEEMSQAHRQLLETVVNHLPVSVCIIRGSDLRLQLLNPAYQAIAPGKEMLGKTLDELWPEVGRHFEELCRRVLRTGEPHHAIDELHMIRRSPDHAPEPAYFSWSLFRIRLPGDEGWGILNTAWETTERKNTEEKLRRAVDLYEQQVRLFEGITSTTPDFVYLFDTAGRFIYANRHLLEVWGMELTDVTGKTCLELGHEQWHHDMHMREIAQIIETKRPIKGEVPFKAPRTGIYGVYEYIFTPVLGPDGNVEFVAGTTRDVTERKRAEEALIESEARFQRMADGAPVFLWVAGRDKQCTYFNKPWLEFTGRTMEQELGYGWTEGVHPDDVDRCIEIYTNNFDARKPFTMEYRLRRHDGELRWLLDSGIPLYGTDENFVGYIGSCIDISERRQMEEALKEADRCKDEFLATLAHELRNPLAPLRNALHVLRLSAGDERAAERTYAMMERQVNHLVRLVDDLLEVSRITRGKIELKRESVELAAVIRSAIETSQPLIEAARHRFIVSLPEEELLLDADPVRLTQVFANLLNNAAKYMEPGGDVRLTAWREEDTAVVSVQDMGLGISAEALPHVFDLFTQIDRSAGRAQGGLGIGLALAQSLAQLHGGSLSARSAGLGQGSEFIVRLPLRTRPGGETVETRHTALQSLRRILVVDDNRDAADSLALLLKCLGADVHVVYNGPAALEAMETFKPSVVLLDIGMPGMDGHEVARQIRQQSRFQDVTLIALTGWGQEADRSRSQAAGFDHHLTKPADIDALQALLASLERRYH